MRSTRKVIPLELQKLVEQGLSGIEMAKALGVTPGAISQNLKALGLARAQDIVLKSAEKINRRALSVMDRAHRNAGIVAEELEYLKKKISDTRSEDREKMVKSRLDHVAEDRKLSDSLVAAARAMVNIDQVTILQRTIEDIFEKLSPELKNEFITELRKRRALSSTIGAPDRDSI